MGERFFRLIELVFTAYAVPALLVPLVWLGRRLLRGPSPGEARAAEDRLNRAVAAYGIMLAVWIGVWLALAFGIPIERGGRPAALLLWVAYLLLNGALASLLVRFTAGYAELPNGTCRDRLFLRFLAAVVAQPLATACAFTVLYRIMGVVYHLKMPGLTAVQEGI